MTVITRLTVAPLASVNRSVNVKDPAVVGVPVMRMSDLSETSVCRSDIPGGKIGRAHV